MGAPKLKKKSCTICGDKFRPSNNAQKHCSQCRMYAVAQPRKTKKKQTKKQKSADLWTVPRKRPKTTAECFQNPLVKVDIQTGEVIINRLWEHWAGRRS